MSHIKVFFIAKIKNLNEEYKQKSSALRKMAEGLPGFISIDSQEIGDVEITISCWKDKEAVKNWAKDPTHMESKKRANEWYHWVKGVHVEAVDELDKRT